MGDTQNEKTPAGRYLAARMEQAGFRRKVDLATAASVSPSTITRLFTVPTYRPDVENTRKLAAALQVSPDELMAGMAGEALTPPEPPALHPLAAELGRMLAPGSPLSESTKALQELLVDRTLEPARREMRAATELVLPEDAHTKALVEAWQAADGDVVPLAPPETVTYATNLKIYPGSSSGWQPVEPPEARIPHQVMEFVATLPQLPEGLREQALEMLTQFTLTLLVATTGAPPSVETMMRMAAERPNPRESGAVRIPEAERRR